MSTFDVVEICAGAGGQALGLERAGFEHVLAVELDSWACQTLLENRPKWKVAQGDVADREVWDPEAYEGVSLLAGGVPCPPFSIAGKQLGANDERDLFAWAVEACSVVNPDALLLENVRGLSMPRFAAYRQHVLDRLKGLGYTGYWKLLQAADYGVPQLRPRFVLVALKDDFAPFFRWPEPVPRTETVGQALHDMMGKYNWRHRDKWVAMANDIAPTIVGGSKKHGGADLGPTRAKAAWKLLGVDGLGVANDAPERNAPSPTVQAPKLTVEMVARLQGWDEAANWTFAGKKTAQYRQVGNAFPPPLAQAVGESIFAALDRQGEERDVSEVLGAAVHDAVYSVLKNANEHLSANSIIEKLKTPYDSRQLEVHIARLAKDFVIDVREEPDGPRYRLQGFRAFIGQDDHDRHLVFAQRAGRSRIS